VKYAIPLGTILLLAAAAAVHRTAPPAVGPTLRPSPRSVEVPEEAPSVTPAPAEAPVVPAVRTAGKAPGTKTVAPVTWQKLLVALDRGIDLTPIQRPAVEQALRDREEEIKALHDSILRSGVIDIRRYDWQADVMKDAWYRKLDALLDRTQHEKFLALVHQGFLNEGLSFTVEPGMTVLD
jgi:hypothetical protein